MNEEDRNNLEKIKEWYIRFSSTVEDHFPTMDGYVAHNNILWMIRKLEEKNSA